MRLEHRLAFDVSSTLLAISILAQLGQEACPRLVVFIVAMNPIMTLSTMVPTRARRALRSLTLLMTHTIEYVID